MKRAVASYDSVKDFTKTKLFFVLSFSVIFILLSSFHVSSNRNILVKEAAESEKEECKVESEEDVNSENIFGFRKTKLAKKSPPPRLSSPLSIFPNDEIASRFYPYVSVSIFPIGLSLFDFFGSSPRYIKFHSFIFYQT